MPIKLQRRAARRQKNARAVVARFIRDRFQELRTLRNFLKQADLRRDPLGITDERRVLARCEAGDCGDNAIVASDSENAASTPS